MALKGPLFLLGRCLEQDWARGQYCHLAHRLLELGLLKKDKTRGHVFQAIGAVQMFFENYPEHRATVNAAPRDEPYEPEGDVLSDWKEFIESKQPEEYGGDKFGFRYNYGPVRTYLTPKYGGKPKTGGGGDNEFKIVMRLVAALM